jgi:hypothetical protein
MAIDSPENSFLKSHIVETFDYFFPIGLELFCILFLFGWSLAFVLLLLFNVLIGK